MPPSCGRLHPLLLRSRGQVTLFHEYVSDERGARADSRCRVSGLVRLGKDRLSAVALVREGDLAACPSRAPYAGTDRVSRDDL